MAEYTSESSSILTTAFAGLCRTTQLKNCDSTNQSILRNDAWYTMRCKMIERIPMLKLPKR